jgi:hypothetical protein
MILTYLEVFKFCQKNKVQVNKFEIQISKWIIFCENSKLEQILFLNFFAFFPKKLTEFLSSFFALKNLSSKNEKTKVL